MLSLFAPVLTTPLLKISILLPDIGITYVNLTAPNPPPSQEERSKYASSDFLSDSWQIQSKLVSNRVQTLIGLITAETTTILAQQFPSRLSDWLLSILAPSGRLPLDLTPRFLAAGTLVLAAGLLRIWTYRTLGRFFRWQLSLVDGHRLVTAGPYAWVRHPSYVAGTLVSVGNLVLLSGRGSYFAESGLWRSVFGKAVAGAVAGYLVFMHANLIATRVEKEDQVLRERFGQEWEEWARKTPYKLIPYVY